MFGEASAPPPPPPADSPLWALDNVLLTPHIGWQRQLGQRWPQSALVITPLLAPELGSCASSGRAWRLWAARHSQGEAQPMGPQPLPQVIELAASSVADSLAFLTMYNHVGSGSRRASASCKWWQPTSQPLRAASPPTW